MSAPATPPAPPAPLAGVLIVDLSRHLPGPLAAQLLAGLGARVLKVEEPRRGDPTREAPPLRRGRGALAALLLSGVESLALDLKKPAARRVLEHLLAEADVLLESLRPGTLARFGFAPRELRRRYPELVICSVSGWGQDGPQAPRAGHDLTYQALAGGLASTAAMPAVPVADITGAWSAATAILAALYRRRVSGGGTWIDASLFDAGCHANLMAWVGEAGGARAVGEKLALTGALPCYNLYRAADGRLFALALLEPKFWRRFCDALGRRDLLPLQYRATPEARGEVAALMASRDREAWAELMAELDLPGEPVLSAAEARSHPQTRHRALLRLAPDGLPRLAFPALFDGRRPGTPSTFPALGGHTSEILEEHGPPPEELPRHRRRAGIGHTFSWRRWLLRFRSVKA